MKLGKRSKDRFVLLGHGLLKSEAWARIGPVARDIYIELNLFFNGFNNGQLIASYRYLQKKYGFGFHRIQKGFLALLGEQLIEVRRVGELEGLNGKRATQYWLTGKYGKIYEKQ